MNIEFSRCCISISPELYHYISSLVKRESITPDTTQITVNLRDTSYSVSAGGYHPVEFSFQKNESNDTWSLRYITDYCYYGSPYAELVKEVDFDFSAGTLYLLNAPSMFIKRSTVRGFYRKWESNFLAYIALGAFNQIVLSVD